MVLENGFALSKKVVAFSIFDLTRKMGGCIEAENKVMTYKNLEKTKK
ncbi:hypothetical protein [Desulfobotulus alkaliphilus]|nr:hypothetical protein [Desulfobotulus alkaliphilus]